MDTSRNPHINIISVGFYMLKSIEVDLTIFCLQILVRKLLVSDCTSFEPNAVPGAKIRSPSLITAGRYRRDSGYCEGELCCIESAVGAEYIGGKRRYPPGGAHSCMLPEVADEAFEVAD
jgi:hypothetical protein